MKSRLTELAMQLANRKTVHVLDYAPAEHRPTWGERMVALIDFCRDSPLLCVFTVGLVLCIASAFIYERQLSGALTLSGVTLMSSAVQCWLHQRPRW